MTPNEASENLNKGPEPAGNYQESEPVFTPEQIREAGEVADAARIAAEQNAADRAAKGSIREVLEHPVAPEAPTEEAAIVREVKRDSMAWLRAVIAGKETRLHPSQIQKGALVAHSEANPETEDLDQTA